MKNSMILFLVLVLFAIASCRCDQKSSFNPVSEKKKILEMDDLNIKALIDKDLNLIRQIEACSPDSLITIVNGKIIWPKNSRLRTDAELIGDYNFNAVKYTEIVRVKDPIINFSSDGCMAFFAGEDRFASEFTDSLGNINKEGFVLAYLAVYEKRDTCWAMVAFAQTMRKP